MQWLASEDDTFFYRQSVKELLRNQSSNFIKLETIFNKIIENIRFYTSLIFNP